MPAIWLFPHDVTDLSIDDLQREFREELGYDLEINRVRRSEEGLISDVEVTVHIPEQPSGKIRVVANKREDRSDEIQDLVEEIVEQAEDLEPVLNDNVSDVALQFGDTNSDMLAGYLLAFALADQCDCGLLVTGLPATDEDLENLGLMDEEDEDEEGDDLTAEDGEFAGDEEAEGDDDDDDDDGSVTATRSIWFSSAAEFAQAHFVDEDEEGSCGDDCGCHKH